MIRIARYLTWIELFFTIILLTGILFSILHMDDDIPMITSLIGLSITYWLSAYKPIEIISNGEEKFGMRELLAWSILPKICWISCGVSSLGVLLFFINPFNEGYKTMLTIGGFALGGALVAVVFLFTTGVKQVKVLAPVLLRAVPWFLLDLYFLMNSSE